ncbi:hypothetical protein VN97_g9324, partial [Penicillium thymicola]
SAGAHQHQGTWCWALGTATTYDMLPMGTE